MRLATIKNKTPILIIILSIMTCALVYWPGLYGPIVLDDWSNLGNLLEKQITFEQALTSIYSDSGPLARPVSMISFIANSLAGHDLIYWKLTNLVIHLITGGLLYILTIKLLRFTNNESRSLAVLVTVIWLIHPLHVSTVLYTVQRMTQLSALFIISGLIVYLHARMNQIRGKPYIGFQALVWLALFPLGIFSKENALLFPLIVLLLELYIIQGQKINSKVFAIILSGLMLLGAVLLFMAMDYIEHRYVNREFTITERLLTQPRVLVSYLNMLITPSLGKMGFMHDGVNISKSLYEPYTTLPSIILIFSLLVGGIILRIKQPLISFGILFFIIGHLIESTILPLELKFEHRNYLPSFGIIIAIVFTFRSLIKNSTTQSLVFISYICLLVFVLFLRIDIWASPNRLYYHIAITHPESQRHAAAQARQYAELGDFGKANERIKRFKSAGANLQRLHIECLQTGSIDASNLDSIESETVIDNYFIMELTSLANLGLDNKCKFSKEMFLDYLRKVAVSKRIKTSNRQIVLMYLAHYAVTKGQHQEALRALRHAFSLNKTNPTPLYLGCEWILDGMIPDEPLSICQAAIKVSNQDNLGKYNQLKERIYTRFNEIQQ